MLSSTRTSCVSCFDRIFLIFSGSWDACFVVCSFALVCGPSAFRVDGASLNHFLKVWTKCIIATCFEVVWGRCQILTCSVQHAFCSNVYEKHTCRTNWLRVALFDFAFCYFRARVGRVRSGWVGIGRESGSVRLSRVQSGSVGFSRDQSGSVGISRGPDWAYCGAKIVRNYSGASSS